MSEIILKQGESTEITLLPKKKAIVQKPSNKSGSILPTQESEYLARRKTKKGIRFFDLAVKKDGSNFYNFLQLPVTGKTNQLGYDIPQITNPQYQSLLDDIYSFIFSEDVGDFATKFKIITKSGGFADGIRLLIEDDNGNNFGYLEDLDSFENDSLTVKNPTNFKILADKLLFFPEFVDLLNLGSGYKVTDEFDFNADSVSFQIASKADIFLVPELVYSVGYIKYQGELISYTDAGGTVHADYVQHHDLLNAIYSTCLPREHWTFYRSFWDSPNPFYSNQAWDLMKQLSGSRILTGKKVLNNNPAYDYSYIYETGSVFPASNDYGINYGADFAWFFPFDEPSRLIFIIKQNSQVFYIWKI